MKKLFLLSSIVVALALTLTGCGGSDDEFLDDAKTVSLEGILEAQTDNDGFSGTHTLSQDNGEIVPLRSIAINLSDLSYLNNRVSVLAVLDPGDGVYSVTGLSVLEKLSDADEDSEIVEYMNSDFGFKVKHYDNWEIDELGSTVSFLSPNYLDEDGEELSDNDVILVSQSTFSFDSSVFDTENKDTPFTSYAASNFPDINDLTPFMRKIGSDSMDALRLESEGGAVSYYIYRNGLMFEISFEPSSEETENDLIFSDFVNSFQFVGLTDSADEDIPLGGVGVGAEIPEPSSGATDLPEVDVNFTYFESLPYSFKADYPASWYYAGTSSSNPDVRHHYGFSDESVEGDNELISLEIVSNNSPIEPSLTVKGHDIAKVYLKDTVTFFSTIDGQNYKVTGNTEYEDLMLIMIASITTVEHEDE